VTVAVTGRSGASVVAHAVWDEGDTTTLDDGRAGVGSDAFGGVHAIATTAKVTRRDRISE